MESINRRRRTATPLAPLRPAAPQRLTAPPRPTAPLRRTTPPRTNQWRVTGRFFSIFFLDLLCFVFFFVSESESIGMTTSYARFAASWRAFWISAASSRFGRRTRVDCESTAMSSASSKGGIGSLAMHLAPEHPHQAHRGQTFPRNRFSTGGIGVLVGVDSIPEHFDTGGVTSPLPPSEKCYLPVRLASAMGLILLDDGPAMQRIPSPRVVFARSAH